MRVITLTMKRICNRPIQIDALTLCFAVINDYHYQKIIDLDFGVSYDLIEFKLTRVEGRYYNNVYVISYWDGEKESEFGQLKFNLSQGNISSNTHLNGAVKVWLSINNEILYKNDFYYLDYIATTFGLEIHNITTLDLCLDTSYNISKRLKSLIRNKSVTTILNGKRITNRFEDRPEITYTLSGSLDKDKYMTVNVKQRKAIKDKSKGVTVITYDKVAEVKNSSDKEYILSHYGYPKSLFRTEVHLNNEEIKDFFESNKIELTYWSFADEILLEQIFFYHLNCVIRFEQGKEHILWQNILGKPKLPRL